VTPWVHTLFSPLEEAARVALGVGPEVDVRARPREDAVDIELSIPGGEVLRGRLGTALRLEGEGPAADAVRRLHRAWKAREPRRSEALLEAHAAVRAYEGLDDAFYRRVFTGPQGTIGSLRLGFGCNQDCGLCWQSRRWPDPPDGMLETWMDELGEAGVAQLTISGGEPTVRRALPALLARAKALGMRTMVQTNAVRLARDIEPVRGVDRLFVSLHAADPQVSDAITRAPGTHERTLRGIRRALDAGLRVGISTVMDRLNRDELAPLARLLATTLSEVESVTWSRPQPYFDAALWEERVLPWDELREPLVEAVRIVRDAGIVPDVTSGSCGVPACLLSELPEHIHLPPAEALGMADAAFDEAERAGTACAKCALRRRCQGPGGAYLRRYGDRGLSPFEAAPELSDFPLSL